jgi:hypothetical protein
MSAVKRLSASSLLAACLIKQGLVPKECGDIDIEMPVDGAVRIIYRVFVDEVDLEKLGKAFTEASTGVWPEIES